MKIKIAAFSLIIFGSMFWVGIQSAYAVEVWEAKYWDNRNLEGDPVLVRNESGLSHEWGDGSPGSLLDTDAFSAQWTTVTYFNEGTYRFTATMDDGMRVFVDGDKIIDVWYDSQLHDVSADVNLSAGNHKVVVEYYEAGGKAIAKIDWVQVSSTVNASGQWTAEYFNNTTLSGSPARTQQEAKIDYTWGGSPAVGVNADQFSARWSGVVPVESGVYRFTARADDGVRLWVNGERVIDQWREQEATSFSADVSLSGGSVPVVLEYYDQGGTGSVALSWSKIASTAAAQPTTVSSQTITDWKGEYFNNINLSGSPVIIRNDVNLNFSWGSSSPIPNTVNNDLFSVRWSRDINLNAGTYSFKTAADDGVRLWVNDKLIIDHWTTAKGETINSTVSVPGGSTKIRVEYFELTGLAEMRLEWSEVDSSVVATSTPVSTSMPVPTAIAVTSTPVPNDSTAPQGYAVLKNARILTMRAGPGIGFGVVGYLDQSSTSKLIGRSSNGFWIKILRYDGTLGWSSRRYLSSPTPFDTLPIVN